VAVLISDGGFPTAADHAVAAAASLLRNGIRVDVIAAGAPDADARARLAAIASAGGGHMYELATELSSVLPAIRVVPAAGAIAARVTVRDAWSQLLGEPPTGLADMTITGTLAWRPAADAIVLADAGDNPLLAIRGHGAGRVLAYMAELRDPIAADIIDAARALPPAVVVDAVSTAEPPGIDVRAVVSADADTVRVLRAFDRELVREVPLIPDSAGTYRAHVAGTASTLDVDGVRTDLSVADPERLSLGVAPGLLRLHRHSQIDVQRERAWSGLRISMTIGILMMLISLQLTHRYLAFASRSVEIEN
jgi:hypothetical protein